VTAKQIHFSKIFRVICYLLLLCLLIPFVEDAFNRSCYSPYVHQKEQCSAYGVVTTFFVLLNEFVERWEKLIIATATVVLAFFTATLWRSTAQLSVLAKRQDDVTRAIQRAYVKVTERKGTTLVLADSGDTLVNLKIKNWGATPANVTALSVTAYVHDSLKPFPTHPIYGHVFPINAFLVAGESFVHQSNVQYSPRVIEADDIRKLIQEWNSYLFIVGYVDYTDKFGVNHRGGFARQYQAPNPNGTGRSYLTFVEAPGYNYDEPRED
jgi:hypothetical protein